MSSNRFPALSPDVSKRSLSSGAHLDLVSAQVLCSEFGCRSGNTDFFSEVDFIYSFQSRPCPLASPLAPDPAEVPMGKGRTGRSPHGRGVPSQRRDLLGLGGLWVPARSVPALLPSCGPALHHVPRLPPSTAEDHTVPKHILPDKMPCLSVSICTFNKQRTQP